jgi:cell division protein FtsL
MATADWFAPALPEPAPAPRSRRRARSAAGPAPARRRRARSTGRRLTGGIAWMAAFALLLVGVVALNVAVLRANMSVHRLDDELAQLRAQNQAMSSQLSAAGAAPRIEAAAQRLGLVQAPASDTLYLDLGRP